jgi:DNA excision repair protein ERCC-2
MVSAELEAESIVVFDEAHNIDSVCIEALSVTLNERKLEQATRSLGRLSSEVTRIKTTDSSRLQTEYQNLVNGLIDQGLLRPPANDAALGSVSCFPMQGCYTLAFSEQRFLTFLICTITSSFRQF